MKKKRKCRTKAPGCEVDYIQWSSFQSTCSNPACAIKKAVKDRERREAKERSRIATERKTWRLANRTIAGWCLDARRDGFNPYVRYRDREDGCIVCGRKDKAMYHSGHFMSVGSRPELQFHPDNAHKQCSGCNCSIASVAKKYRANLVDKIGVKRVEYLENYHATTRWTVDEIKEIKKHYQGEVKRLKDL